MSGKLSIQELLFEHGFVKDKQLASMSAEERRELLSEADKEKREELLGEVAEEKLELSDGHFDNTGYPSSVGHLRLVWESPSNSIEDSYFWILEHLRQDRGFYDIIKIQDLYAASEASAFWGNQQQRISAQQNNAQGLLANIGKFVKELFQMVRELRIIDERLEMYVEWNKKNDDGSYSRSDSADVTLKSLFTDQVEGGTKNPQSVFGLAQTVGFTILPDLFFNTRVYDKKSLEKTINEMDVNEQIKNVLRRKLYQFLIWKERTHEELQNRRTFNLRYLQQHWHIIKTYMSWAKPYLKNLQRLQMRQDLDENPEIISSFDQSLAEVEILAKRPKMGKHHPVIVVNFTYRSRPDMNIRKEYQQGPSHMGRLEMNFRAYSWTEDEIAAYKSMKKQEDIALLGVIDDSLQHAMEALGDDFRKYLDEMDKKEPKKDKKDAKETPKDKAKKIYEDSKSTFEPFLAVFGGFAEIFTLFIPIPKRKKKTPSSNPGPAAGDAMQNMFLTWHIYKKAKRMLTW